MAFIDSTLTYFCCADQKIRKGFRLVLLSAQRHSESNRERFRFRYSTFLCLIFNRFDPLSLRRRLPYRLSNCLNSVIQTRYIRLPRKLAGLRLSQYPKNRMLLLSYVEVISNAPTRPPYLPTPSSVDSLLSLHFSLASPVRLLSFI